MAGAVSRVGSHLPYDDRQAQISHRHSAEDFRPDDGQCLLARVRQARKYAKEADKALQNIEVAVSRRV